MNTTTSYFPVILYISSSDTSLSDLEKNPLYQEKKRIVKESEIAAEAFEVAKNDPLLPLEALETLKHEAAETADAAKAAVTDSVAKVLKIALESQEALKLRRDEIEARKSEVTKIIDGMNAFKANPLAGDNEWRSSLYKVIPMYSSLNAVATLEEANAADTERYHKAILADLHMYNLVNTEQDYQPIHYDVQSWYSASIYDAHTDPITVAVIYELATHVNNSEPIYEIKNSVFRIAAVSKKHLNWAIGECDDNGTQSVYVQRLNNDA